VTLLWWRCPTRWSCSDLGTGPKRASSPKRRGIRRSSGTTARRHNSLADAVAVIEGFERSWLTFAVSGTPTGVAFAIVDAASGEPVGMCGVDDWSNTDVAQFGYWLAAGARGRGFATRAVTLMTDWLFTLGAARVLVTVVSENAASAAVARRAGFTYEGTLRAYGVWQNRRQDVDVFAVLPQDWVAQNGH
jgi:RimJ/RimL family protein N-acetyltransferase